MASMQCQKTSEKGLGQGFYGGRSSWESQSNKHQNGYSMSYTEHERHAQIRCPTYGNTESYSAYEYGKTHGAHGNAMSKPQFHGHGNGYMNAQAQGYASNHQTGPGYGYGYGHGNGNHGTNGHGKFMNHGTTHGGKLSGHGNGFMKPQKYGGHGGNMAYGMTETETREYSEVYYSNESHYNNGGRGYRAGKSRNPVKGLLGKIKGGLSGNDSCSDSENDSGSGSDSDDDVHGKRTVCVSKAL